MNSIDYGIQNMTELHRLPLFKRGVKVHYEGSIDKQGANADWDWWLYQDDRGEWVIFDAEGPGCIYNFVQHRYPSSEEPTFKFYFDGEPEPRFTIRHSQFGEVYPFIEPLASRYIGPVEGGRGPIRVVRSFVPMAFAKSCRITSDIKLEGFERSKGHGGWGHVIWHSFSEAADAFGNSSVKTFSPDDDYSQLIRLWKNTGFGSPFYSYEQQKSSKGSFKLFPGSRKTIFRSRHAELITDIRIQTRNYTPSDLSSLWISASWDRHIHENRPPDIYAPFGCMFSNELGYNGIRYLLSGMDASGGYYCCYPMPFSENAEITLENHGDTEIEFEYVCVQSTDKWNELYRSGEFGYFRTSEYYTRKHTEGADSIIAEVSGSGHIVSSVITGFGKTPDTYASCEGDVRVHIDGIRTPQIESDGSESYACYGWGYPTPPECNPASGYDGYDHRNFSMTRQCMGDWYPFLSGFRFGIESGGNNDSYLEHSGMVFYYGTDEERMIMTDEIKINGTETESYFEGDDDHIPVKACGVYNKTTEFTTELTENTDYVIIRRMSDQTQGCQKAEVSVDGVKITDYTWYFADRNPFKQWLEDEFVIPSRYISDKKKIRICIEPCEGYPWNTFGFQIFCVKKYK